MKSATKRDLAIFELNEEISLFNPTTLKVTETTVRNTLPSAEGKSRFFFKFSQIILYKKYLFRDILQRCFK